MAAASGGQPLVFLSTHPTHESRMQALEPALARYREARAAGRRPACDPP